MCYFVKFDGKLTPAAPSSRGNRAVTTIDIELGLSEEDCAIRDLAHKFAEEVLRPAGVELDRMADPADMIAPGSVLWKVIAGYHELGLGALTTTARWTRSGRRG